MADIEVPRSPSPPKSHERDDSAGTLFKLAGGCCLTICGCCYGPFLLFITIPVMFYGVWWLTAVAVVCIIAGCLSAKYTWDGIHKAAG